MYLWSNFYGGASFLYYSFLNYVSFRQDNWPRYHITLKQTLAIVAYHFEDFVPTLVEDVARNHASSPQ